MNIKKNFNLLIIGSNFGKSHLISALRIKKFTNIYISSPNIFEKKIPKNIIKYKDFKNAINKQAFDIITIATTPNVQNKVLNFIYIKKKFPKILFLEKPVLPESINILKKISKNSKFLTDFIFSFNLQWINFKKIINNFKKIDSFEYEWLFKQAYFTNNKKTWKINPKEGGGLINYYLPHAIFNILNNFKNIKFHKVNKKKYFKGKLIYLEITFLLNKKQCHLKIGNFSELNLHKLTFKSGKIKYSLINKTKDWLANFKIYKNEKEIKFSKKLNSKKYDREFILSSIYSKIFNYIYNKDIASNKLLTYKTFELISIINKKI